MNAAINIMRIKQWLRPAMLQARLSTWRRPKAVFLCPGVAPDDVHALNQVVPSHGQALLAWRGWCEAHAGQRCLLGLSSRWLLHALLPVGEQATRSQAVAEARRQWAHYFNVDASGDAQAVGDAWHVRAVRVGQAWLVGAMPAQILADFLTVADAHGVALHWMGPWWARGGPRWLSAWPLDLVSSDARDLCLLEPGWCVGLRQAKGELIAVWASQNDDLLASRAEASARHVRQVRIGTASKPGQVLPVLWDDASTQALLEGRLESQWLAEVSAA